MVIQKFNINWSSRTLIFTMLPSCCAFIPLRVWANKSRYVCHKKLYNWHISWFLNNKKARKRHISLKEWGVILKQKCWIAKLHDKIVDNATPYLTSPAIIYVLSSHIDFLILVTIRKSLILSYQHFILCINHFLVGIKC
jgi:hypothetical protein